MLSKKEAIAPSTPGSNSRPSYASTLCPHNASIEARGKLRRLRQMGGILDYNKEFTTVMLEIGDLSEKDALFHFKDGLKDWARVELDRRNVQTLKYAIAAVELLIDYYAQAKAKKRNTPKSGGERSGTKRNHARKDSTKDKVLQRQA